MQIEKDDYFIVRFNKRWETRVLHTGEIEEDFFRCNDRSYFTNVFKAHYVTDTLICAEIVGFLSYRREDELGKKIIFRRDEVELETVSKAEFEFAKL